jgi:hypothetical protein
MDSLELHAELDGLTQPTSAKQMTGIALLSARSYKQQREEVIPIQITIGTLEVAGR